ncbi:hypothetical protein JY651_36530 [Pyxidicoccus parkwayensis]|uniref:CARDB domain-containing protein n=1 Tax=Pyxidicoccus parkwayensis TaxID=2813578 RepID=A0ABX7NPB1_9BACT|nr:CARDB domain-containing protein [Pyxidicoccus parkwaysis]QSQ20700.1 hypothetical protein JY651_36530 [Pyxidicoccus parkwaysis]
MASLTLAACGETSQTPEATSPQTTAQALATGPDFVVTSVTGPTSVRTSDSMSVTVQTCNQGTQSGSVAVELYLSSDNVITPNGPSGPSPDIYLQYVPVYLGAGECRTDTVQTPVWVSTEGAYYLGAVADPMNQLPETNETNNIKLGGRIGVGNKPDLVVTAVTAPIAMQSGAPPAAISVSVCNLGTQPGNAPLEVFASQDSVIVPRGPGSDLPLGYVNLQPLMPGQCRTEQVQPTAGGLGEGVWYVGAVVDSDNFLSELIEDNNTRVGNRMGVGYKPELVVTAVSGPASAQPGSSINLTATVCNQGTQPAPALVEWYLSQDAVITPRGASADVPVGYTSLSLNPGQCATRTIQGYAGGAAQGPYYLGAAVDPDNQTPEFFDDNNTRAGSRIGLGSGPDLVVAAVSGPTSALPGQPFSTSVRVCNQGTASGGGDVELYLSQDNVITPAAPPGPNTDQPVGMASVFLAAAECRTLTVTGYASGPEGAFYLGAVVDPRNSTAELLEDNNTRAGSRIGVGSKADFVVTSVSGPASVTPGQSFNVTATVCNQGTANNSTGVEILLSQDSVITPNNGPTPSPDFHIGMASSSPLAPGACQTLTIPAYGSAPQDGAYYLGAVADPANSTAELLEDNNTRAGSRIGVGYKPDLTLTSPTAPSSARPYQSFNVSVQVCNKGTQPSGSNQVHFYASEDTVITPNVYGPPGPDLPVAMAPVGSLTPGQCQTVTASASGISEGAWYLGAVVDPQNTELEFIEDNNTSVSAGRFGVGDRPDFVVTSITTPASIRQGQSFTASVRVCNQGTWDGSADVELYLSEDSVITPNAPGVPSPDFFLGGTFSGNLAAGVCQTVSINAYTSGVFAGSWNVGAVVDVHGPVNNELLEDNNTRLGNLVVVTP